ncbi:hypothetical protein [Nocardiopsis rhodophaea]|uniref:hypothetical protein n=1 Tax=Nocardiopsis rhodophaea TaxID=280238 RepID=UPI0031DDF75E
MHLWIGVPTTDPAARSTAVDALHDAGLEVQRTWVGELSPDGGPVARRDPAGVALGAGLLVIFGGLAWWLADSGGWWIIAALLSALVALVGVVGAVSCAEKKPRVGS